MNIETFETQQPIRSSRQERKSSLLGPSMTSAFDGQCALILETKQSDISMVW